MDVFSRQHDGTIQPVRVKALDAYKRQNAAPSKFIEEPPDIADSPDKVKQAIRAVQDEVRKTETKTKAK